MKRVEQDLHSIGTAKYITIFELCNYLIGLRVKAPERNVDVFFVVENIGLLLASGLIAGQALMGIITAAVEGISERIDFSMPEVWNSAWLGLIIFFALGFILIYLPYKKMIASGEYGATTEENES